MFELSISQEWPDQFTESEYVIDLKGLHRAVVKRDDNRHFLIDRPIIVSTASRVIPVEILSQDSSLLESELQLALCADDDELLIFDLDRGDQLDIWDDHLNLNRGCAMLCKSDLVIRPEASRVRRIFSGDWTIHRYPTGLPPDLRVQLEDQILWTPPTKQLPALPKTPPVDVLCSGGAFGHRSHVRIVTQQHLNIRALYIGRQLLRPRTPGDCSRLELELLPDVDYNRAKASVIVEENSRLRRLQARLILQGPITGAAIEHSGHWQPVIGAEVLDRADLFGRRLLVRPPLHWHGDPVDTEDWALLEGSSFCARLRRFSIRNLDTTTAGVGQSMSLNVGPYNNDQPGIPLALGSHRFGDTPGDAPV